MFKNVKSYFALIILTPIIAGIYGILHDQITYTISSEYFTNFKFIQFNIGYFFTESKRFAVGLVGFLATWWVGIPIGIILGLQGIKSLDSKQYIKQKIKAIRIVFITAIIFGFIGYISFLIYIYFMGDWPINIGGRISNPELAEAFSQIKNIRNFLSVGFIHNFSYFGGAAGLLIASIFQYRNTKKLSHFL